MRLRLRSALTSLLTLALLSPSLAFAQGTTTTPAPAAAPGRLSDTLSGDAKNEYEAAKILYADGDYAGSALKFHHAYALSGDARLLWNEAAAEKNQRHYARVEALIREYMQKGGATTEAERSDAQGLLDTVRAFIADLTLNVNEAGAQIFVDNAEVGVSPLSKPLRVDMGPRRLRVSKPGFKEFSQNVEIVGGGQAAVDVKLSVEKHEGTLRVVGGVGTTIRVDGKMVGMDQWQGALPSGLHTIEVTADKKQPYRTDSLVQDGELSTVQVSLQNEPSSVPAASGGSSGAATWLWVAGGAVLAAGVGLGTYFALKPTDQGPPKPIVGTIGSVELGLFKR
ncbi:MAG: PEGA domain-containing protein [Polyangiaceae bacterium]